MDRKTLLTAALCGALTIVLAAPPGFAQISTSPGRKVAFETKTAVPLPGPAPGAVLTAQILKGKKKHVISVDAMVTSSMYLPGAPWLLSASVDVNGIQMDPTLAFPGIGAVQDCSLFAVGVAFGCTLTSTFLMDLDAAELANPGVFVNMPLTITLSASDPIGFMIGAPVDASMAVRMEKKR